MAGYPWDVGRSESEVTFLQQLERLSGGEGLFDAWTYYPQLVVTLCIADPAQRVIVRTLRVDYDGHSLQVGNDPSGQIDPALNLDDPDYFEFEDGLTPHQFADRAFEWFRRQALRPIDRLEWDGKEQGWFRWVLADDTQLPMGQGGDRPDRQPDRVVRLKPPAFPEDDD